MKPQTSPGSEQGRLHSVLFGHGWHRLPSACRKRPKNARKYPGTKYTRNTPNTIVILGAPPWPKWPKWRNLAPGAQRREAQAQTIPSHSRPWRATLSLRLNKRQETTKENAKCDLKPLKPQFQEISRPKYSLAPVGMISPTCVRTRSQGRL